MFPSIHSISFWISGLQSPKSGPEVYRTFTGKTGGDAGLKTSTALCHGAHIDPDPQVGVKTSSSYLLGRGCPSPWSGDPVREDTRELSGKVKPES